MNNIDLVRLVAGILFVLVLYVLIQRRRKRKETRAAYLTKDSLAPKIYNANGSVSWIKQRRLARQCLLQRRILC